MIVLALAAVAATGCGPTFAVARTRPGQIVAVGAESEYANVISQIGGRYVAVTAIETDPNADPHTFEASPSVARVIAQAGVVVQNGLGYDTFMNRVEAASERRGRHVIDVQHLLGLPDSTANPHLWYAPRTMPAVAHALVAALSALQPAHRSYFAAGARRFEASLAPWDRALTRFAARYPAVPVATTEPVGNDLLRAAGARILTPFTLQADVMNGVDPAPQAVSRQSGLLAGRRVRAFLLNEQVTDSVTQSFLAQARAARIPVVGLYETMPTGYDYQSWMLAELAALQRAVADGRSTPRLT